MGMAIFSRPPCEIVVNKILPSVRGELVRVLSNEHDIRQTDIADMLGITQASVSQYMNASRGKDKQILEVFPEIKKYAGEAAKNMIGDNNQFGYRLDSQTILCRICKNIRGDDRFIAYLGEQGQLKDDKICDVCIED